MPSNRYYFGPQSDHFDGRFFNTAPRTGDKSFSDVLRWRRTSTTTPWPATVLVSPAVPDVRVAGLRVTIVGHATVLIQAAGLTIVTDPLWSDRASPFSFAGPKRVCAPGIRFDDLPPVDLILLSHNHYDHLDIATLRRLVERDDPLILTPLGNDAIVRRSIPKARLTVSDWWGVHDVGEGVAVTLVPAQHWSARGLRDRRMALWCGFHVAVAGRSVYFAGDTGYGDGSLFRTIRDRLGPPDLALLPIGAYAPRWFMGDQHVDPAQAIDILVALEAASALGIHWGVLPLSDEGRNDPADELTRARVERGMAPERFVAAEPGHVRDVEPAAHENAAGAKPAAS